MKYKLIQEVIDQSIEEIKKDIEYQNRLIPRFIKTALTGKNKTQRKYFTTETNRECAKLRALKELLKSKESKKNE